MEDTAVVQYAFNKGHQIELPTSTSPVAPKTPLALSQDASFVSEGIATPDMKEFGILDLDL